MGVLHQMASRLAGRLLQGSDVRSVDIALRDKGLARELDRAIARGDSPNAMNRVFKQAGYRFNRFQTLNYLSQTVKPSVLVTYTDAIAARYGRNSAFSSAAFERAGYSGDVHIKVSGLDTFGNYKEVVIKIKSSPYEGLSQLTKDIIRDIDYYTQHYPFQKDTVVLDDIYLT